MMKINITKRLNRFLAVAGAMLIGALPALAQESSLTRVAANDCGVPGAQPFLVKGENYTMPSEVKGSKEAITCNFGGKVIYAFNQLDIHADYQLEVVYLADHERKQRIVVDGNEIQNVTLEAGKEKDICWTYHVKLMLTASWYWCLKLPGKVQMPLYPN